MGQIAYIPDGYEEAATIPANAFHPAVSFRYRPMRAMTRTRLLKQAEDVSIPGDVYEQGVAQECAARITVWDLRNEAGDPLPISQETFLKLEPNLSSRMFKIIARMAKADAAAQESDRKN